MADFNLYLPKENKLEGTVFENDANDEATKYGITLGDLKEYNFDIDGDGQIDVDDVRKMTHDQAALVLRKLYWDFFSADNIPNQSLAEFIVDSGLNQGKYLIATYVQSILGLFIDSHPGAKTLKAIIDSNPILLYKQLYQKRFDRYNYIIKKNPKKQIYYNGWINRLNAIKVT